MDKITVVIPSFNSERSIEKTLQSVINQTYIDWECVVVDDGSLDNSFELCENICNTDNRLSLVKRNRAPKGAQVCRNVGVIDYCKTDFFMFLDSDDLLTPTCLENRMKSLDATADLNVFLDSKLKTRKEFLDDFYRLQLPWNIMAPIWKKSAFMKIGGFDESFTLFQDPEIHTKAMEREDFTFSFHKNILPDTVYTNQKTNKGKQYSHAIKLLTNIERYFFDEHLNPKSKRDAGLKAFYKMLLDYYQLFKGMDEMSKLFNRHSRSIKEMIDPLVYYYFVKSPRIKGAGRILKLYEENFKCF